MSPRAACRLAALGFVEVYDYMPGKVDWLARGLPREGQKAGQRRAVDVARDDVVTCALTDEVGDVVGRIAASPYGFALVVGASGTLLGRLRRSALAVDVSTHAADVMAPGPSTVRADTPLDVLRDRLDNRGLKTALVTNPDGVLLGVVRRVDLA